MDTLRLFREVRLSPWEPDQAIKIRAHLASLEVEDPEDFVRMKKLYEEHHDRYCEANPGQWIKVKGEWKNKLEYKEEPKEEPKIEPKEDKEIKEDTSHKKRGRPSKK